MVIHLKRNLNIEMVKSILSENIPELKFLILQDSFSDDKWMDVFNKNNSILKIANIENISNEDIICFGDVSNDVEMIKKCGVAMVNSLDSVKEVSNFITLTNDEDGIIYFLKNYLNT